MKISIIATFYNSVDLGDFVNKSMNCLLNQTYKNIEFICINDGSKDDTLSQLKAVSNKDNRVKVYNKENQGSAQYAKSLGQEKASGDFIMFFDHDDIISLNAIEEAVKVLKNDSDLDAVSMLVKTYNSNGVLKSFKNLDINISSAVPFDYRIMTGLEMLENTVGNYTVNFRGLIRNNIFKSISYNFSEKLINADEIVERLIFCNIKKVSSCKGIYSHYIYYNSSFKSSNINRLDVIKSDVILRQIFINSGVYENHKLKFELSAFKNIISNIKLYHTLKSNLNKSERKEQLNKIKNGYINLNRFFLWKNMNFIYKCYHGLSLSSFNFLIFFYSIRKYFRCILRYTNSHQFL